MLIHLAAIALPCTLAIAGPVELVYQFPENEQIVYEMVQTLDQQQSMFGETTKVSSTTSQHVTTELIETRDDGTFVIGNTTSSIVFSMTGGGLDISYDSNNPEDASKLADPTIASLAALNGVQVQLLLNPSGTILDVPNLDQLQQLTLEMEDPSMIMMLQRDTIIATNEANYKFLPTNAVNVDDSWKHTFTIPFELGEIVMNLDLTLDQLSDTDGQSIATISMKGDMSLNLDNNGNALVTPVITKSSIFGILDFNIDAGVLENLDMTTHYGMQFSMDEQQAQEISIGIEQNVKMTRLTD